MWCFLSPQCIQFDLVSKHYILIIGMPMSAMGAGALVTLLRSVDGPIKFKFIGFEFEGAAGQIVMFVLVFLGSCWRSPRYETSDRPFKDIGVIGD